MNTTSFMITCDLKYSGAMDQSKPQSLTVGKIMTERLESINILNTAQEAAVKMANRNVSSLVALDDNGKVLGIVTERIWQGAFAQLTRTAVA
jgi:signal-transduction protein with cAMP-binding, CBS, and nucleotidyltransferase domain